MLWHIYVMEYYSAIKRNSFEPVFTKWINLEPIIPSIVSQKERKQISYIYTYMGFPGGSEVKASASNAGDLGSIPGSGDPLEKEMATHSSILAWRIPWTEKPGRLQPTGSQSQT